ncbi:hypothetical protein LEL_05603 [Akanthomyces lecanii RCEF 1005]|uniref:C6 zinc finger domain protein n=1 Tax=Akanthomyces lecanii RCEF 1005 TaxID=1081108 RepID=A0A162N5M1_CORDF|nr:hypothetical protein LEL_05603 [Akanthomyces lecanii RCEF 1005]
MVWQARQLNPALLRQPIQTLSPFPEITGFQERQLFYFFRQNFVLAATTVFDAEFWSPTSLLACQRYPAGWHAALAMAAFLQQTKRHHEAKSHDESDDQRALNQWLQDEDERYELEHCNKAMRCLIGLDLSTVSYADQEMVLVSSLLLTRYYRLRGNPTGALIQVRNGLGLLNQWDRWQCTTGQRSDACLPNCVTRVSSIWYPFVRLYMELLDSPLHVAVASQMLPISPPEISNSRPFKSVDEVFKEMLAILMSLRYSCGSNILVPVLIPNFQQHRRSHRKLYEAWKWKFAEYRHSAQFGSGDPFGQTNSWGIRLKIVKMYEQRIYMSMNLDPSKGNLAWDELSHHFERIIAFADDIIDTRRRLNAYETFPAKALMCMIPNLGDLLQVICSVVRDRAILGRALVLLKQHEYRSGFFRSGFFRSAFVAQLLETKAEAEQTGTQTKACAVNAISCPVLGTLV